MYPQQLALYVLDSNADARAALRHLVQHYCKDVYWQAEGQNIGELRRQIRHTKPDVIIADIEFDDGSIFNWLAETPELNIPLILISHQTHLAFEAFQYQAVVHFVGRPIQLDDFENALLRAARFARFIKAEYGGKWTDSSETLTFDKQIISLPVNHKIRFLTFNDILYVKGSASYSEFYLKSGEKILISKHLKALDKAMQRYPFFRSHQSYIINLLYVADFSPADNVIHTSTGTPVPLARRKKKMFLEQMERLR